MRRTLLSSTHAAFGWAIGLATVTAAIGYALRRMLLTRTTRATLKVPNSKGAHSGSTGIALASRKCVTWRFKLAPWTEEERSRVREVGRNADITQRYALRVTDSGEELQGFFVFRQPKQLAELSREIVDAQWQPANFKADWPIVERVFGSEVHTWDARATSQCPAAAGRGGGSTSAKPGRRGAGGDGLSAHAQPSRKRVGPAHFHAGRDFKWEELQARYEPSLLPLKKGVPRSRWSEDANAANAAASTSDNDTAMSAQIDGWERHFVRHADAPSLFFKERRYLLDQFPMLRGEEDGGGEGGESGGCQPLRILETGCGNGSSVLPILKGNGQAYVHATDPSASAVAQTQRVVAGCGEALAARLTAEVQPTLTEPCSPQYVGTFDLALIVFTLSAVPGDGDVRLLRSTAQAVRPGGRVLIRDYGLYDMRHLGDAASSERIVTVALATAAAAADGSDGSNLKAGSEVYQYRRPGGMFRRYYSLEDVERLAADAGLVVDESRYLCIRLRNEKKDLNMDRVYVSAVLRRAE